MASNGTNKPGPRLWKREFVRNDGLDRDIIADEAFRKAHFLDYFGRVFLAEHWDKLTYNDLIMEFFKYSHEKTNKDPTDYVQKYQFQIFCASDGAKVVAAQDKELWEQWAWLNQHIRFVAVVSGREDGDKVVSEGTFEDNPGSFTLFLVGSESPDSTDRFMDATCWDGNMFRFYARDWMQEPGKPREEWQGGWVYQGASVDAFSEDSYLGPFGGHVNGSLVMKELHRPWPHWFSGPNPITDRFPQWIKDTFTTERTPYISNIRAFDQVSNAEDLEKIVMAGIGSWMGKRAQIDFRDGKTPRKTIKGVQRWLAHVLLTTTINIAVAQTVDGQIRVPHLFAYNSELTNMNTPIKGWFPATPPDILRLDDKKVYDDAILKLGIDVYHVLNGPPPTTARVIEMHGGILGGGKDGPHQTEAIQTMYGEGESALFTMLQPSYEDARAVAVLMAATQKPQILTTDMFLALMMIDACNPIFSWRRGVLMQYVPDEVNLTESTKKYDLETTFVNNVKASPRYINDKEKSSPEAEFIRNFESLTTDRDKTKADFQAKMKAYYDAVTKRLRTADGMKDYLRLIQSKHRLYRPVPLNEFALTLPFMVDWPDKLPLEMTYEGQIQPMADRGAKFFMEWLSTLMGPNPKLIPRGDAKDTDGDKIVWTLGDNAQERSMTVDEKELVPCRRRQACPVLRRNPGHVQNIAVSAIGQAFLAMVAQAETADLENQEDKVPRLNSQLSSLEVKS